ncbi:hypothetical protein MJT46_010994 [Ovis ammon polii x Ovis aries]|nr:hypothetical protein MJT46_010994 [Ovis ammon polii x Ovis aries]
MYLSCTKKNFGSESVVGKATSKSWVIDGASNIELRLMLEQLWRSAMTLKAGHARDSSFILQDTHLPPPPDGSKNLGGELLEQADQTLVWEGGKEADAGVLGEEEGYVAALRPEATHVTCTENPKEGKEKAKNSALQLELRLGFVCDGTGLRNISLKSKRIEETQLKKNEILRRRHRRICGNILSVPTAVRGSLEHEGGWWAVRFSYNIRCGRGDGLLAGNLKNEVPQSQHTQNNGTRVIMRPLSRDRFVCRKEKSSGIHCGRIAPSLNNGSDEAARRKFGRQNLYGLWEHLQELDYHSPNQNLTTISSTNITTTSSPPPPPPLPVLPPQPQGSLGPSPSSSHSHPLTISSPTTPPPSHQHMSRRQHPPYV